MIVVTGATGSIGRYVLRHLLHRGAAFKALVRDASRGDALGVPYVVADFDAPASLGPALAGADGLFLNGPVDEAMVEQQTAAVRAAAAGVTRIVRVSAAGASRSADRVINRWHGEIDAAIDRSGIASARLLPTFFTENLLMNAASVRAEGRLFGGFGEGRLAFIDCSDIAECAAVLLTQSPPLTGAFTLTGREVLSFAEVAAKLSRRLGRDVVYVDRPVAGIVASMKARGMAPSIAESFGQMMESFARGGASAITSTVRDITGHEARTVDDFLNDHLDRFR